LILVVIGVGFGQLEFTGASEGVVVSSPSVESLRASPELGLAKENQR